jgi:hypothetical protein
MALVQPDRCREAARNKPVPVSDLFSEGRARCEKMSACVSRVPGKNGTVGTASPHSFSFFVLVLVLSFLGTSKN